ncbi:stage III sporulation protein SpoIIIAB [Sporohalobacter salinus]|uniref:stage III sporulation protein SpoIIIAB n=1 Tax=Sporohalobacter salinus TaxID=1494606 RepID=UPI001961EFBD|nr:stage III sporulation protein SpoIIIAB [Sporohalobacter salinus]MBM7622750.1 stage III sporulation protein AB [Sporohalobacter salinus]
MIKLMGGLLIVGSASCLGFLKADQLIQRTRQLQQLQIAFQALETEIMYAAVPLPKALQKVSNKVDLPISDFFLVSKEKLETEVGITAQQAWKEAVKEVFSNTALTIDDQEILLNFGNNLGNSDRLHQEKNLKLIQEEIKQAKENSVTVKKSGVKKWRYFGVLGGLLIVILLY